jgi:septal ring factor EnvC (AmiA/AmiB activator)
MTEKQLTPEEIQQIKSLQEQIQEVTLQLGTLEVRKINLKDLVIKFREEEEKIAQTLSNKYGTGTLDINTGKITITDN